MPALSHKGFLALKQETTWGTKDVTSMQFMEIVSETLDVKRASKILKSIGTG